MSSQLASTLANRRLPAGRATPPQPHGGGASSHVSNCSSSISGARPPKRRFPPAQGQGPLGLMHSAANDSDSDSDSERCSQAPKGLPVFFPRRLPQEHAPAPPRELPSRVPPAPALHVGRRAGKAAGPRADLPPASPAGSLPPPEPPRPPPPRPVGGSVSAVCTVVYDMLQMKYGLVLDEADLRRKMEAFCFGAGAEPLRIQPSRHGAAPEFSASPADIVAKLNAHPGLQFRDRGGDCLVTLCVETHSLSSSEEVVREVRRMRGTARVAAVVASGERSPGGRGLMRAVALFREAYGAPGLLVGRGQEGTGCRGGEIGAKYVEELVEVDAEALRDALALDPQITSSIRSGVPDRYGSVELETGPAPALRDEYMSLGAWLLPDETVRVPPHEFGDGLGHVSFLPFPHVLANAANAAPVEPTQRWLRRLRPALEHPDAGGETLLAMLTQVADWLSGCSGKEAQVATCGGVEAVQLHRGLVGSAARAGNCSTVGSPTGRGTGCGVNPEIAVQAGRAVGYCIMEAPASQVSFQRAGAVEAMCQAMRRCPGRPDVQRAAAFALRHLLGDSSGAADPAGVISAISEALRQDLPHLIDVAVRGHPGVPDLQGHCARAMQLMASNRKEWTKYQDALARSTSTVSGGGGSVPNSGSDSRAVGDGHAGASTYEGGVVSGNLLAAGPPLPPAPQGVRPAAGPLRPPALLAVPPLSHLAELAPPPAVSALISPLPPSDFCGSARSTVPAPLSSRGRPTSPTRASVVPAPPPFGALPPARLAPAPSPGPSPCWDWATTTVATTPATVTSGVATAASTPQTTFWTVGALQPQPGLFHEPRAPSRPSSRGRSPLPPMPVLVAS